VSLNSNTTVVTSGAEAAHPSETPVISEVRVARSLELCNRHQI